MKIHLLALLLALSFVPASSQTSFPALLADKPAPELKDKLMLFGQFIGSWTFQGVEYHDNGTSPTDQGEIHFGWVLDGRAVQDVWIETGRSDSAPRIYGTTIRFYEPKTGSWRVTWIEPRFGVVTVLRGQQIGDEIVMDGQAADGTRIHWIFSEIKQNSFRWRAEKLIGKDWRTYEELWAKRKQ